MQLLTHVHEQGASAYDRHAYEELLQRRVPQELAWGRLDHQRSEGP